MIANASQFAQIRVDDGLGAAPNQKEEGFAAPTARRVTDDITAPLGRRQRRLRRPQHEAIRPLTKLLPAAGLAASRDRQEVARKTGMLAAQRLQRGGKLT